MTEYSDEHIELIERDEANSLSDKEKTKLADLLSRDTNFRELYKNWHVAREAIDLEGEAELRKKLKQGYAPDNHIVKKLWPVWAGIAVAAVISLLVLFSGHQNSDDIFQQYYSIPTFGLRGNASPNSLEAQELFHNHQFSEVISAYESLVTDSTFSISAKESIQLAVAYAESNQLETGIRLLKQFPPSNMYIHQARWYLGLFLLQSGEKEEAKRIFIKVALESKDYGASAREILELLDD